MEIRTARLEDADAILALQNAVFQSYEHAPQALVSALLQPESELLLDLRAAFVLLAIDGEQIVGSIRAHTEGTTSYISRLMVASDKLGQGIGTRLLAEIEAAHPHAQGFAIVTARLSDKYVRFYRTRGYLQHSEMPFAEGLSLIHMNKRVVQESATH